MKQLILCGAAALVLAAMPGVVSAQGVPKVEEDGAQMQAVGRVRSVTDREFTLEVRGMTFHVTLSARGALGRPDFRDGDRVRVEGELVNADRIRAEQVRVVERERAVDRGGDRDPLDRRTGNITGTIRRIDRENRTMVVHADDGNYTVKWEEGVPFFRDNVKSAPREFRAGDEVRVVGRRLGGQQIDARRVFIGGKAGWTNNAIGEITGINSRSSELQVDFNGEIWTVRFRPGDLRSEGRAADLARLRIGEDVRVSGTSRANRVVEATSVDVLK